MEFEFKSEDYDEYKEIEKQFQLSLKKFGNATNSHDRVIFREKVERFRSMIENFENEKKLTNGEKVLLLINPLIDGVEELYKTHDSSNIFNLICVENQIIKPGLGNNNTNKINFEIKCQMISRHKKRIKCSNPGRCHVRHGFKTTIKYYPFMIIPSSNLDDTPLRTSSSPKIINNEDELTVIIDNHSNENYEIKKGDRLFQIVRPNLEKFNFNVVDKLTKT